MARFAALLCRAAVCDGRLDDDEGRPFLLFLGFFDRGGDGFHILVAVLYLEHLPAIGFIALFHIFVEGAVDVALDGDIVLIVQHDEFPELLRARKGACLAGNAFLQAAVAR